jgi:ABC-type branched-subunit amino acid transport system ATPase component
MVGARAGKKLYHMVYELFPVLADRRRQRVGTLSGGRQQ